MVRNSGILDIFKVLLKEVQNGLMRNIMMVKRIFLS